MDDFLSKPLRPNLLEEMLAKWVRMDRERTPPAQRSPLLAPATVLDVEMFREIKQLDGSGQLARELMRTFKVNAVECWKNLGEASQRADGVAAGQAAHTLKGGARQLGAVQVAQRCERIEAQAKVGDFESILQSLDELERDIAAAHAQMEREL